VVLELVEKRDSMTARYNLENHLPIGILHKLEKEIEQERSNNYF